MSHPDPEYIKRPTVKLVMDKMRDIFNPPCPSGCGGRLKSEFIDMQFDKMVYRCDKCGKEFI